MTKTNALESLVIAGFVRGLSVRDVEATLVEALGEGAAVSKSTVSRVCEEIQAQFEAWSARRLDDVELDYLFLDGSHFGTVNLRSCGRSANHISLIRHTRPGESRKRTAKIALGLLKLTVPPDSLDAASSPTNTGLVTSH